MTINRTEIIDFTQDNKTWNALPLQVAENIEQLTRLGLMVNNVMRDKNIFIKDGQKFVVKQNSFHPHTKDANGLPLEKLDISTAVNEYTLYSLIKNISNTPGLEHYKELYAPVELKTIISLSTKGTKVNTKAVSITPLLEDYYSMVSLKTYFPDKLKEFQSNFTVQPPEEAKLVAALIGRKLTTGDVLFNSEGDIKIVDLGDASPKLVMSVVNEKLLPHINNLNKEDKIETITKFLSLLTAAIENVDATIAHVYSIYNKINIEFNPQENSRTSGMRLYQKIWMHLIPEMNALLAEMHDSESEVDLRRTINIDYNTLITYRQKAVSLGVNKLKTAKENIARGRTQGSFKPATKQAIKEGIQSLESFKIQETDFEQNKPSKSFNAFEDEEDTEVLETIQALNEKIEAKEESIENISEESKEEQFDTNLI